jgi:hypothetical protein
MLLCDWAQEINGKLYIMGAGWSRVVLRQPLDCALAVKIDVPWDRTNDQHKIRASLVTEDGSPVIVEGNPVMIEGAFETGRPAGLKPGSTIDASLALRFGGFMLDAGRYVFKFNVNGKDEAEVPFDVIREG